MASERVTMFESNGFFSPETNIENLNLKDSGIRISCKILKRERLMLKLEV